jgi:hypothetical protein
MSDLAIGLVAEGDTDFIIIEAVLKACIHRPFVLTQLQPEATRPTMQGGWGGVYKWCRAAAARGFGSLENDPTLFHFDLLIIHVDADVADKSYSDLSVDPVGVLPLPCTQKCPPPAATIESLRAVVLSWLGIRTLGARTVLCTPSKATEAWLAAAVASDIPRIVADLECSLTMEARLVNLPKGRRIRKTKRQYQNCAKDVQTQWSHVVELCSQARRFQDELSATTVLEE